MDTVYTMRQATPADIEILSELRMEFLRETAGFFGTEVSPELEKATQEYIAASVPSGDFIAWLAEADGQVIGTSGLVFFKRPPTPGSLAGLDAYVLNMYTIPSWRGRGVATALLKETLDYIKTTPAKRALLRATDAGRPLYEKLGFVADEEFMSLSIAGD